VFTAVHVPEERNRLRVRCPHLVVDVLSVDQRGEVALDRHRRNTEPGSVGYEFDPAPDVFGRLRIDEFRMFSGHVRENHGDDLVVGSSAGGESALAAHLTSHLSSLIRHSVPV